jgi:hypothetical protein
VILSDLSIEAPRSHSAGAFLLLSRPERTLVKLESRTIVFAAMRNLTPTEAALAVAIGGCVLFAGLPAFFKNLHASRMAEPVDGVSAIAAKANALAAGQSTESAYPGSVELTPAQVPRGERVIDPPGTWSHPTWQRLEFSQTVGHCFSFAFDGRNGKGLATFRARAHGDLDGDGIFSTFAIGGESREGSEPKTLPLEIVREVE